MVKMLATLLVAFQRFCDLFSDDEAYDPSWMDRRKWEQTRV